MLTIGGFFLFFEQTPQIFNWGPTHIADESALRFAWFSSIIGLVVEFVVAIDEARVRFTDDALPFFVFVPSSNSLYFPSSIIRIGLGMNIWYAVCDSVSLL